MRDYRGLVFAALTAIALAILATTPPLPLPKSSPAAAFSADRAMDDVVAISAAPRPSGSPENAKARAHLIGRMRALGMAVETTGFPAGAASIARLNSWSGGNARQLGLTNILGILPGRDRSLPAVMLMAHHDSVWGSPGAADDAAGVASALEVVRAIRARGGAERDLVVLFTDGEELGLEGARHFFAHDPLRGRIGAVINLEARGGGGRATLFQTSKQNGAAIELLAGAVARPGGSSLAAFVYSVLPNDTDLTPALAGPYTAYNFAFIGRAGLYHSPLSTPERLDRGAMQDMGAQALDLAQALLAAPRLPGRAPDVVFFDAFGRFMIVYPAWLGWAMLGLSALALALAVARDRNVAALAGGAARIGGLVLAAGLLFTLLNLLSGAGRGANYYDRLAAIPLLEAMVATAALGLFLLLYAARADRLARLAGAVLPFWALGLVLQIVAPTAAYVVLVPVLLVTPAIAARAGLSERLSHRLALAVAALVSGYMIALGHQLMQGVGPSLPMAAALPLGLGILAGLPAWPGVPQRAARGMGIALLLIALAIALWVRLDPVAGSIAVYSADKS